MRGDLRQKRDAELLQFPFAHSADPGELAFVFRILPCHLPQRNIRENDVRRHALLIGHLLAQLAQALEQRLVARDFAGATLRRLRRGDRFGQRDCLALRQCRAARRCQFNHGVAVGGLSQITQPHQLPSDGLPLASGVVLADAVSRELVMPPFADFFRVGAGEHLDGVIQTKIESGSFPDAINAR